jgi:citrate lyase subunit beta/citryl-CoA lyase
MMASPRVKRAAFGSADFTLDIGSEWNKDGEDILYARSRIVLASRAAGRDQPIDGVFVDIKDEEGFRKDCCLGRKLGFQGKLVIHPSQLDITNQVYSPTAQEVTSAKKVVEAFDLAEQQGLAAIQVEGKLVDYPVVIKARQILARAQSIGIL